MRIVNEEYKTYNIESIDEAIPIDYFWVLDLSVYDWMLTKLVMLEEFFAPMLKLSINGKIIEVPAEWQILIYSPETSNVDMVQASDLAKGDFSLFVYEHSTSKVLSLPCRIVGYSASEPFRTPTFNKNNMVCYPIGNNHWIMIAPTDTYNKYLKNAVTIGNFIY